MKKTVCIILLLFILFNCILFIRENRQGTVSILNQEDYDVLSNNQKKFIADVLEQGIDIDNNLPIGSSYLTDEFLKLSVKCENNSQKDNIYNINVCMKWNTPTNLKNAKAVVMLNEDDWEFITQPYIRIYESDSDFVIDTAIDGTFSGECFALRGNHAYMCSINLQVEKLKKTSQRKIIIGYFKEGFNPLSIIDLKVGGNKYMPNSVAKWKKLEF